jgi:hypothetical protein
VLMVFFNRAAFFDFRRSIFLPICRYCCLRLASSGSVYCFFYYFLGDGSIVNVLLDLFLLYMFINYCFFVFI